MNHPSRRMVSAAIKRIKQAGFLESANKASIALKCGGETEKHHKRMVRMMNNFYRDLVKDSWMAAYASDNSSDRMRKKAIAKLGGKKNAARYFKSRSLPC